MNVDRHSGAAYDMDAELRIRQDCSVVLGYSCGEEYVPCGVCGAGGAVKCLDRRVEDGLILCKGCKVDALERACWGSVGFLMASLTLDFSSCCRC